MCSGMLSRGRCCHLHNPYLHSSFTPLTLNLLAITEVTSLAECSLSRVPPSLSDFQMPPTHPLLSHQCLYSITIMLVYRQGLRPSLILTLLFEFRTYSPTSTVTMIHPFKPKVALKILQSLIWAHDPIRDLRGLPVMHNILRPSTDIGRSPGVT